MLNKQKGLKKQKKTITSKSIEKIHNVLYTVICYIYIYVIHVIYVKYVIYDICVKYIITYVIYGQ